MNTPILSLSGVTKRFGGLVAVNNLDFDIFEGEAIGLMGPNGAGKTTLISLISGCYKPTKGTIRYKGDDITGLSPHRICHLGIAKTYQVPKPFSHLTTLQNIAVSAMYGHGMNKEEAHTEAERILDIVDLVDKRNVPANNLEALTLKRLELAKALATNPSVLLIDEVAAGLTDIEMPRFLKIIDYIKSAGITYIMIEHVLKVMLAAVTRVVVIEGGTKIAEGNPQEVMKNEKVIKAYLG